ncbi:MAG: hypothetical protein ACYCSR_12225 [Thiomonas sp.]
MQTKPIITAALAAAALCAQVALANTLPATQAAAKGFSGALQAQEMRLKNDAAVILDPHIINCSPPGFITRALYPDAQEVCQATATIVLVPLKP